MLLEKIFRESIRLVDSPSLTVVNFRAFHPETSIATALKMGAFVKSVGLTLQGHSSE